MNHAIAERAPFSHTDTSLYRLDACKRGTKDRETVERYVTEAFRRSHGAEVRTFLPLLLTLRNDSGELCGVVGVRAAREEPLYLEHYLDRPVEQAIASLSGTPVGRDSVVELGNFACRNASAAKCLMQRLPHYLLERGHRWIAFTGTGAVRTILSSLDAPLLDLGRAKAECVAGGTDDWGNYYSTAPHVMAGYLPLARDLPGLWSGESGN